MYQATSTELLSSADANGDLAICFDEEVGVGVVALVKFAKGDLLDRFTGNTGSELTQHSLQIRPDEHISDTRFVGYISHGCNPNCRLDMQRRELVAMRDIAAGELLTIDYAATEDRLFTNFSCNCDAENCRGWIVGRLDMPKSPEGGSNDAAYRS
ncbi:MAG: SET domain-containing protein-lysine N-methyltransferase [Parasphingorhabdus sp.]